jgi:polysaccharide biosynthesis/export protein
MKKVLMSVVVLILVIFVTVPSLLYSQESKPADSAKQPGKKLQGDVIADSDQYIIGPEDVLHIYVWREDSLTKTVPVRIDGKISLPLVDDVKAAGLTPLQLKEAVTIALKGFVDNPNVSVTVMEANSFKVYVTGEVKQPGVLRIRSEVTLVKLITMAGGFTEWADKKKIMIVTKDKGVEKRVMANYNRIVEGEVPDIVINRGDLVIVK